MCLDNSEKESCLTVLVNTDYSRITIHKRTLKALEEPKFIQLGYNPDKRQLLLFRAEKPSQNTIRIRLSRKGACYIYSKSFIESLIIVSGAIKRNGTYLLKGEMNKQLAAAFFSLDKAEKVIESTDRGN